MRKKRVNKLNVVMFFGAILLFVLSTTFCILSFDFTEVLNNKLLYIYNTDPKVNYDVDLFENNMFKETNLPMGEAYVSNVVNDINIDMSYNFSTNYSADLTYTYKVENVLSQSALSGKEKEETSIWSETYTLVEPVTKQIKGSNIYIGEEVVFDYDYYKELIQLHKKVVNSSSSEAQVKMTIDIEGKINENDFKETKELVLTIPLDQEVFEIETNFESAKTEVYKYPKPTVKMDKLRVLIFASLMCISLFLIVMVCRKIKYGKQNYYTITLNKILKEYGDVIIEVMQPADLNKSTTIEVKNFNEMIDLEERLRIPINFCETKRNKEGLFWLRYNDQYYRFILKNK